MAPASSCLNATGASRHAPPLMRDDAQPLASLPAAFGDALVGERWRFDHPDGRQRINTTTEHGYLLVDHAADGSIDDVVYATNVTLSPTDESVAIRGMLLSALLAMGANATHLRFDRHWSGLFVYEHVGGVDVSDFASYSASWTVRGGGAFVYVFLRQLHDLDAARIAVSQAAARQAGWPALECYLREKGHAELVPEGGFRQNNQARYGPLGIALDSVVYKFDFGTARISCGADGPQVYGTEVDIDAETGQAIRVKARAPCADAHDPDI